MFPLVAGNDDDREDSKRNYQEDATASSTNSSTSCSEERVPEDPLLHPPPHSLVGNAEETADPSLLLLEPGQRDAVGVETLSVLARQLEYYLSQQNLLTDTYLQTLRSLNDGCVPVSILADFTKVKAIIRPSRYHHHHYAALSNTLAEHDMRIDAILRAAADHSELLQIYSIDTATGKIANDETPSSANTILAVGTVTQEPLPFSAIDQGEEEYEENKEAVVPNTEQMEPIAASGTRTWSPVVNTLIFRDVQPHVTEEQIREVFAEVDGCPNILSIHRDVNYCWFITLDTASREEMMNVLMQVRCMVLADDYIHARLKSSTVHQAPLYTCNSNSNLAASFHTSVAISPSDYPQVLGKKKKRIRKRRKKKCGNTRRKCVDGENHHQALPIFEEIDFPTLAQEKVEWDKTSMSKNQLNICDEEEEDEEEDEEPKSGKSSSDAASTATTTSSSLESIPKKSLGGYVAAVLKTQPATSPVDAELTESYGPMLEQEQPILSIEKPSQADDHVAEPMASTVLSTATHDAELKSDEKVVTVEPSLVARPSWGQGRSFADILRPS